MEDAAFHPLPIEDAVSQYELQFLSLSFDLSPNLVQLFKKLHGHARRLLIASPGFSLNPPSLNCLLPFWIVPEERRYRLALCIELVPWLSNPHFSRWFFPSTF